VDMMNERCPKKLNINYYIYHKYVSIYKKSKK